jgi:two-component system sensor histidine kinase RpfC
MPPIIRQRIANIAELIRRRLGFAQAEKRDVDAEQAFLRVFVISLLMLYAAYSVWSNGFTPGLRLAIIAGTSCGLAGLFMLRYFHTHTERPAWLRYFGIGADLIPLTIGLAGIDETGVPLIGVYLWVILGNGFRFGPRYLMAAYWLSGACFALLMLLLPFWQTHRALGIGFMLILATVPLYVLVLLSRLTAQKDAAEQLSNAKSRFVANVSHELRTPLTGVFAVYDLLKRHRLAPDERELVGSLGSAITTLKASVDAVLQMSKLEAGAERAERRPFNLRFFLQQLDMLIRPQASAKSLTWAMDVDLNIPSVVCGDVSHLHHVLGNLINNALKFTANGGVILRAEAISSGVRFEVIDTGIGIPVEQQEKLFERFVQADNSATRRFGGTGLGTSIARDLTVLMGGTIGVRSARGNGSTFWVELPLTSAASTFPVPAPETRHTVLVVGAESERRQAIANLVSTLGYGVDVVSAATADRPSFDSSQYLAALLVMSTVDALAYSDLMFRDRAGIVCPWLVVARNFTKIEAATLLRSGAVGLLDDVNVDQMLGAQFEALGNRIDFNGQEDAHPVPREFIGRLNILLADDNKSNQMLLAHILADAGHDVRCASRGDEAYDLMSTGQLDLAILDLNMPDISGPDVIKLYRAGETGTGKKLPIIVLSADATPAAQQESLDAGANDYLTKPVTADNLLATVQRIIAGTRARKRAVVNDLPPVRLEAAGLARRGDAHAISTPIHDAARYQVGGLVLVDVERIEALRRIANHDSGFLDQYVDAAFQDLESAIKELLHALAICDTRSARDALHKIDGTSASIGAIALTQSAKNMRQYLSASPDTDAAAAMAEITTTCALTKSAVASLVQEARPADRDSR